MCKVYYDICTNEYKNKCCDCGRFLKKEDQIPRANPYVKEIIKEEFLHRLCDGCFLKLIDAI
jgi:hypothetical protein